MHSNKCMYRAKICSKLLKLVVAIKRLSWCVIVKTWCLNRCGCVSGQLLWLLCIYTCGISVGFEILSIIIIVSLPFELHCGGLSVELTQWQGNWWTFRLSCERLLCFFKLLAPVHYACIYAFGPRVLKPANEFEFTGWVTLAGLKSRAPNAYAHTGANNLKSTVSQPNLCPCINSAVQ